MPIFVLGYNHHSAPLEIREQFAINNEVLPKFLNRLAQIHDLHETVCLSTCNRLEIYGVTDLLPSVQNQIIEAIADFKTQNAKNLQPHLYVFEGTEAIRHGFRVSASLDSMVLGEAQILGQCKEAFSMADQQGNVGKILHKFFNHSFHSAKRIRHKTSIAKHPVSISSMAVLLAEQIFGDLSGRKALILGAGKMSELAMRHLKAAGIQHFFIANRTEEKARELAQRFNGEAIPFANFSQWLHEVDVVLSSTNAPHYLIDAKMVQEAVQHRKNHPMFFIDIALPRDVSPDVNHLPNIFLYNLDDLGAVVEANKGERLQEAQSAEVLLEQEVEDFLKTLRSLELAPTISSLHRKFERIGQAELEKALQKLPHLDADAREVLANMTHAIVKKVLHDPTVMLKQENLEDKPLDYSDFLRKVFRLDEIG